jgi:hypothetical protein
MDELHQHLRQNPEWRKTLQIYFELQQQQREKAAEADPWVARQADIPGVEPVQLSSIHGKLIAFGMLKFDVGGRDVGVLYQVTHQGRRALLGEADNSDSSDWADSAN